jgi:hypothetical protein
MAERKEPWVPARQTQVRKLLAYEDWLLRQLEVVEARLLDLGVLPES